MSDDSNRLLGIPDPLAGKNFAGALPALPRLPNVKSPTRAEHRRGITLTIGVALVYQALWVLLIEHRKDLGLASASFLLLGVAIPLLAAALAAGVALRRGGRGLGSSVGALTVAITLAPAFFTMASLLLAPQIVDETAPFWDRAVRCIAVTCALSVPPMVMLGFVFRHAFVAAAAWRSAALGVACGALGAATMSLACSHSEGLHVVVAHGSMMIVGGVLGALLGRVFARA